MNLFTRLPIIAPDSAMPIIPSSEIDYFVDYEPQSYDHWMFGGSATSLIGLNNGHALTAQATPTYGGNYVRIGTAVGNALLTALEDSAMAADTLVAVVKLSTVGAGVQIPFGSLGPSTETPANGGSFFFSAGGSYTTYLGVTSSSAAGNSAAVGNWYFVAVSRGFSGATKSVKSLVGGGSVVEVSNANTYVPATAGRKLAAGAAYYTSALAGATMDLAEFIVFNRALSSSELASLYSRRKAKLASRGISVI